MRYFLLSICIIFPGPFQNRYTFHFCKKKLKCWSILLFFTWVWLFYVFTELKTVTSGTVLTFCLFLHVKDSNGTVIIELQIAASVPLKEDHAAPEAFFYEFMAVNAITCKHLSFWGLAFWHDYIKKPVTPVIYLTNHNRFAWKARNKYFLWFFAGWCPFSSWCHSISCYVRKSFCAETEVWAKRSQARKNLLIRAGSSFWRRHPDLNRG